LTIYPQLGSDNLAECLYMARQYPLDRQQPGFDGFVEASKPFIGGAYRGLRAGQSLTVGSEYTPFELGVMRIESMLIVLMYAGAAWLLAS